MGMASNITHLKKRRASVINVPNKIQNWHVCSDYLTLQQRWE